MYTPTLIETGRRTPTAGIAGTNVVSFLIHAGVIAGAIAATWGAGRTSRAVRADTTAVFIAAPDRQVAPAPPVSLEVPLKGFQTVDVPAVVPTDIPPVSLQERFDPKDFSGVGVEGGRADGVAPPSDKVYPENLVQETPLLLAAPPTPYPDLLRQAGIGGRVLLQAIVDTSGRIEPGSMRILQTPNRAFNAPVMEWATKALFRPARLDGRAVRVIIHLPVDYSSGS
jgi:TonB family protein